MSNFQRAALFVAITLLALGTPSLFADEWTKKTIFRVNQPIEIPGHVLQPGVYVMRLSESPSARNIVEFWTEDEQELVARTITIPNHRMEPSEDTVFKFYVTPDNDDPEILRAWFYPGDLNGQEFAYDEGRARIISERTQRRVPVARGESVMDTTDAEGKLADLEFSARENEDRDRGAIFVPRNSVSIVSNETRAPQPVPAPAIETKPEPVEAPVFTEPEPQPEPEPVIEETPEYLPQTASSTPLLLTLSALLVLGGLALRRSSLS